MNVPGSIRLAMLLLACVSRAQAGPGLAAEIAAAQPGAVVRVPAGVHAGPFVIDKPLTLAGAPGAILDGGGEGDVIQVRAPGVTVRGLVIRNTGISLDRENGQLWTGDSFYEGPIWLFAPETDLEAYERSMRRLADLADALDTVFPAHNTPIAAPNRLVQLSEAIRSVRMGDLEGRDAGQGAAEYAFDGFSLLVRSERP